LLHQDLAVSRHQVDHVIAEKHGGETSLENLALSCLPCNLRKASDIASIHTATGRLVRLFNPRTQIWSEHFGFDGPRIKGLTLTGETTVEFLQLNRQDRLAERVEFMRAGVYPLERSDSP
jgi:hypothetical protein